MTTLTQIFPTGPAAFPGDSISYCYMSIPLLTFNNSKVDHNYAAIKFTAHSGAVSQECINISYYYFQISML